MSEEERVTQEQEQGGDDVATEDELAVARAQADDYLRNWQRAQADLLNYRRRMEQERAEREQFAGAEVLRQLLPVLDDFDRAIAALPEGENTVGWASGVVAIARKLRQVLVRQGLEPLEVVGNDFDPAEHEAVMQAPSTEEQAGKVVDEFRRGYRYRGRVLRPAQVVVGRGSE
ncbi:MAG: nucleotide exchange factor GrpE [Chloroflexota bacterium]